MQQFPGKYYGAETTSELRPCDSSIKANYNFDKNFFVQNPGYYAFDGNTYLIDKEGMYRFTNEQGFIRQFYYFKGDTKTLMRILFINTDYQGEMKEVPLFSYTINAKLSFGSEKNLQPSTALVNTLPILGIPVRQISLYSPKLNNSFLEFLEVWDVVQKSWGLYSVEKTSFLGYTSKDLPSWKLLDNFIKGEVKEQVLAEGISKNSVIFSEEMRAKINAALNDSSVLQELIKELQAVFVYRLDGVLVMRVSALDKDKASLPEGGVKLHENMDINYKVNLFCETEFLEKNYGEKIYVSPGFAVKTF